MTSAVLEAQLDGEVVFLDRARQALVLLDHQAAQVWHACDGRSFADLTRSVPLGPRRVRAILRRLEALGVVSREQSIYRRAPVHLV